MTKIKGEQYYGKIDLLVGGTPCFPKGNLILTEYGYRPIEEVEVGDFVVTHLGRLQKVLRKGVKTANRSEERRVGNECVGTCVSWC